MQKHQTKKLRTATGVSAIFLVALICIPIIQMRGLEFVPGDIGDARLNNLFLENVYQYISGSSNSLWHLPFYYPFPYVLGFSDNLLGTSPVYILGRALGMHHDTAFQWWFLFGYFANYSAAYAALRMLGMSVFSSAAGALIFSFALPTTAHAGHAQLHYRFGIPIAIAALILFLQNQSWRLFLTMMFWTVWQFYAGIYMGTFLILMLAGIFITYLINLSICNRTSISQIFSPFWHSWICLSRNSKLILALAALTLLGMMLLLFYPYIQVTQIYGAKRNWDEISMMLPRWQSYFIADGSSLWSGMVAKNEQSIPMRHEHQMFIGAIPLLLFVFGAFVAIRSNELEVASILMLGVTIIIVLTTLHINGHSAYYLLHKLPLLSAIRVLVRIDQVILFPAAYFAALALNRIVKYDFFGKALAATFLLLFLAESATGMMSVDKKIDWQKRLEVARELIPDDLGKGAVIFVAQRQGPTFADELDAMWISVENGYFTMNGYSGNSPSGIRHNYGNDCNEFHLRVSLFGQFMEQQRHIRLPIVNPAWDSVSKLGFTECNTPASNQPIAISSSNTEYSPEDIQQISYRLSINSDSNALTPIFIAKVENSSTKRFSSSSSAGNPIRFSWIFLDELGNPLSDWNDQVDLPFDIPPKGWIRLQIPVQLPLPKQAARMQLSLVQEGKFWAHDAGVAPAELILNKTEVAR